jgi:hypothetical protein
MSATATDMRDFINALQHVLPDTMSPAARKTIDRLIAEARCEDHVGNHLGVIRIMAKVRAKIMHERRSSWARHRPDEIPDRSSSLGGTCRHDRGRAMMDIVTIRQSP